ncbi:MAG: MarR family transcriptional regulator [Ignavibacteria bacterium]|nr:MarR family transcriptional regulator [Ignavibacteria bacterium]
MKLEDEILQTKPFASEREKLAVNLIFTTTWLASFQRDFLKEYSISEQQYNILRILRGQHPKAATINFLKERMLDKMSDASRLVDRLLKKEFVVRCTCHHDRRAVNVGISKKGLALLKQIDKKRIALEKFLSNLSDKETLLLNVLLDKLRG